MAESVSRFLYMGSTGGRQANTGGIVFCIRKDKTRTCMYDNCVIQIAKE
jgi:hypothetical protein